MSERDRVEILVEGPQVRRSSWGQAASLAFGVLSAIAFAAVSMTINHAPSPPSFDGWIAVLQKGRYTASQVKLLIAPETPGGAGDQPRLRYTVTACGPRPFEGALLLGEDARLDDLEVLAPPAPTSGPAPTRSDEAISASRKLKMLDVSAGLFHTYSEVQVLRLALPATDCVPADQGGREPVFFGAAALIAGNARAAVEAHSHGPFGIWSGPRSTQSWPYLGAPPDIAPQSLGEFRFVRGMAGGPWSRPAVSHFEVEVGSLTERATVDFARPTPAGSTSLSWSQTEPYAPIARLTNEESLGRWQTYLVLSTIALAIGASFIADLILRRRRLAATPAARQESIDTPFESPRRERRALFVNLALVAVLLALVRKLRG
ncbi:MAG TPA: hypothetical protein VFT79_08975 [Solirubrobacterales bacterium]|nr:hypothetical protein [Solirubrobacterales bacterium]